MKQMELIKGIALQYEEVVSENGISGIEIAGITVREDCAADAITVPEKIMEKPVVSLAPYSFRNERWLREMTLPETIEKIGSHCFFDCRGLKKIVLPDRITELGDGAFKNCESLEEVGLLVRIHKSTCLKSILAECNETLYVRIFYPSGEEAALVFPRYLLDYEANVEARIINQVTFGTGLEYRECFYYEDVDYKKYDNLFYYEQNVGEKENTARLAAARLTAPLKLSGAQKEKYLSWLCKDKEVFLKVIDWYEKHPEELPMFLSLAGREEKIFSLALSCAQEKGNARLSGKLMEKKQEQKKVAKKFVL